MWSVPTFCHPFFIKETKKLIDIVRFCLMFSAPRSTFPMEVPRQAAFFDWNLTVCFIYAIFSSAFYPSVMAIGNLPILTNTLPNNLVVCLATESDAKRISYFFAHFLILALSLLKALRPSMSIKGISLAVHSSIWTALARTQICDQWYSYSYFVMCTVR